MPFLTKQEQLVLMLFVAVLTAGSALHYALTQYPVLRDIVNLVDSDRLYPKVDINTATSDELVALPYVGEYTAANIIQYRRENGPFESHDDLRKVKGIREKNFRKFKPYLKKIKPNR